MQIDKKDSHDIEIGVTGGQEKVRDRRTVGMVMLV